MKNIASAFVLVVIVLGAYSIVKSGNGEVWFPIYYPNPTDLSIYSYGPAVDTLEQCRVWINAESIKRNQPFGTYDYECGLNCKYDMVYGIQICEETVN